MINLLKFKFAAAVAITLLCSPGHAAGDKTTDLRQKLTEIAALQDSLTAKISLNTKKRDQLKQKIKELKKEINQEKQQRQIDSYKKACDNTRIDYNLKLIQMLSGYVNGLDHKIAYFQVGNETLDFFSQQIQDDLLMIKTLNDFKIDKLMTQINSVLGEYTAATGKPMFEVDGVLRQDVKKIWDNISQTN